MRGWKELALAGLLAVAQTAYADMRLSEKVKDRLNDIPLGTHDITIESRGNVVTLNGNVSSSDDMYSVVETTRLTPGVRIVRNNLAVTGTAYEVRGRYSNVVVTSRYVDPLAVSVRDNIEADRSLGWHKVQINAANGVVFLNGNVEDARDLRRIELIARNTPGVVAVDSDLSAPPPPSDAQLEQRVRSALEPEIDLSGVDIRASDGVVTFRGERPNHRAIDRILSSALMVPGVRTIRSDMTIGGRSYSEYEVRARMR